MSAPGRTATVDSTRDWLPALADVSAGLGAVGWLWLVAVGELGASRALPALAILVVAPLVVRLADTPGRDGRRSRWYALAVLGQPLAAIPAVGSLTLTAGPTAAAAAVPWALATLAVAGFGLWRSLDRGPWPLAELAIDAGLAYVAVGGVVLLLDRGGVLASRSVTVALTVGGMQSVGPALSIFAGLAGRSRSAGRLGTVVRVATPVVVAGPAGVVALALGSPPVGVERPLLDAGTTTVATVSLAVAGFAVAATAGWRLAVPDSPARPPGINFSRLRAGWRVGPDFLDRRGLTRETPVAGMVDSIEAYAHAGFDPAAVAPSVRRFYERTGEYALAVDPDWARPWGWLARLYRPVATRTGQLSIPLTAVAGDAALTGRVVGVGGTDPATGDHAWIRSNADRVTDARRMTYVGVYDRYVGAGRSFLRVAFPLPGANLTGILRLENDGDGLVLSSFPARGNADDAGLYLVVLGVGVRLPLNETLVVRPDGESVRATHRVEALGVRLFTLRYDITRCT
ncbi:YndJ family transporter [Haloarcula salinisoli]|uniref:YndJ family protein n=1 Tax=Haloarcula salinisoli TaxID=2487746 RepID=A0A8J7YAS7_9EURY|nr:YndJ family transporter [Halomicroarcula salinisoli]MBX0285987.1 YndJ family protein [Halomicroarcula salinisoli]MBX0302525.1 YndJ family protein [Halomicroarcula salinisoli]